MINSLICPELRGTTFSAVLLKLLLSMAFGGIIGLERGTKHQAAGFRTHILVCTGACIAMMTGGYIHQLAPAADPARLGAQVINGIGFLGAGTIISNRMNKVRGLTTAAGLWTSACIGLAVGIGFYEAAISGTAVVLLAMVVFRRVDEIFYTRSSVLDVYLEMENISYVKVLINNIRSHDMKVSAMEVHKPKSGLRDGVGIFLTVSKKNRQDNINMLEIISDTEGLAFIEETM